MNLFISIKRWLQNRRKMRVKPAKTESPGYGYWNIETFGVIDQFREAARQCAFDARGTSEYLMYEYGANLLDAVRKHLVQETAPATTTEGGDPCETAPKP